ncbi:MAG: glycine zipper domain-containing protein [Planctomycetota bacterium]
MNKFNTSRVRTLGLAAILSVTAMGLGGCNNALQGGLSGGLIGALGGMAVGSVGGHMGRGAAIGAAMGAIGGAVLGDQNDRNARR